MKDINWFTDRVGQTILVEIEETWRPLTIMNKEQAHWLHAATQNGWQFAEENKENTCVACEA